MDLLKDVHDILNKITPEKYEKLMNKFCDLKVETEGTMIKIIDIFFRVSTLFPQICDVVFSRLILDIQNSKKFMDNFSYSESFLVDNISIDENCMKEKQIFFQKRLYDKCYEVFKESLNTLEETVSKEEETKGEIDVEESIVYDIGLRKNRAEGNIQLISAIYKRGLLPKGIIFHICGRLFSFIFKEREELKKKKKKKKLSVEKSEFILLITKLLTNVGKTLEEENEKEVNEKERKKFSNYFVLLKVISKWELKGRFKFACLELIELREKYNWIPPREREQAKTLSEIKKDVEKEATEGIGTVKMNRSPRKQRRGKPLKNYSRRIVDLPRRNYHHNPRVKKKRNRVAKKRNMPVVENPLDFSGSGMPIGFFTNQMNFPDPMDIDKHVYSSSAPNYSYRKRTPSNSNFRTPAVVSTRPRIVQRGNNQRKMSSNYRDMFEKKEDLYVPPVNRDSVKKSGGIVPISSFKKNHSFGRKQIYKSYDLFEGVFLDSDKYVESPQKEGEFAVIPMIETENDEEISHELPVSNEGQGRKRMIAPSPNITTKTLSCSDIMKFAFDDFFNERNADVFVDNLVENEFSHLEKDVIYFSIIEKLFSSLYKFDDEFREIISLSIGQMLDQEVLEEDELPSLYEVFLRDFFFNLTCDLNYQDTDPSNVVFVVQVLLEYLDLDDVFSVTSGYYYRDGNLGSFEFFNGIFEILINLNNVTSVISTLSKIDSFDLKKFDEDKTRVNNCLKKLKKEKLPSELIFILSEKIDQN